MTAIAESNPSPEESQTTSTWLVPWIELFQLLSVASIAALLPGIWPSIDVRDKILLVLLALLSFILPLFQEATPDDVRHPGTYVIDEYRVKAAKVIFPKDIAWTIQSLMPFEGSAAKLRIKIYDKIGEDRAKPYMEQLYPVLKRLDVSQGEPGPRVTPHAH